MKHDHIPDKELQAAVDNAFKQATITDYITDENHAWWKPHAPYRLHLARALLEELPEPTPPVVDGKTPGQVAWEAMDKDSVNCVPWSWLGDQPDLRQKWERSASAVLAAFGNPSLEAAIARMEAVPLATLWDVFVTTSVQNERFADIAAVRARLIAAVREVQAVPRPDYKLAYAHAVEDVVIWKAKYEDEKSTRLILTGQLQSARDRAEKAEAELARVIADFHFTKLPQLRPISEAGPVPDGCVRVSGFFKRDEWALSSARWNDDTHFADIRLPVEEKPTVEPFIHPGSFDGVTTTEEIPWTEWHGGPCPLKDDEVEAWECKMRRGFVYDSLRDQPSWWRWRHLPAQDDIIAYRVLKWKKKPDPQDPYADEPTPEAEVKPWTPAVGDLVMLKSGGPVMTFDFAEHDDVYNDTVYNCMWIKPCGNPSGLKLPLHMLKPAKEEQP